MAVPALEIRRKGWHMLSGVLIAPLVVYTSLGYVSMIALTAFLFIFVAEVLHYYWGIRLPFWSGQLARTKREHEVFSWASLSFLLTVVVLLWVVPLPVAFAAAAQLALGDGASALVGRSIGRTPLPHNPQKTLEGSLAGFIAGAIGAFLILQWYAWDSTIDYPMAAIWVVCGVGGLAASLAESLPRIEDNVTAPVAAAATMSAMWSALGLAPTIGELFIRLG